MLVGGVLFVGTMIGLTFVTKKMIGKNTEILDLVEKLRVAKMQKEEAVTNATNKPPETIVDATKTDENIENDQEKQKENTRLRQKTFRAFLIRKSVKTVKSVKNR